MAISLPSALVTGYVLAGGASSRMGQDKAFLAVHGQPLVETAIRKLRELCGDVAILCGDATPQRVADLERFARTVPERGRYLGPVAGISAALADAGTPWVLVLAVDQPFLPVDLLRSWLAETVETDAQASCILLGQHLQPLPALLRTTLAAGVSECLQHGERRVRAVLDSALASTGALPPRTFSVEQTDRSIAWFRNLNSLADLPDAKAGSFAANETAFEASEIAWTSPTTTT